MIFTAQIAGLGLMLAPAAGDLPLVDTLPDAAQSTPAQPAVPTESTPPLVDPAATPAADPAAPAADTPANPPAPQPKPDCAVCGPVYAKRDPLIGFNRISYKISQPIDRFILRPPAMLYMKVMPKPARDGVHNFLANFYSPVTFVNDVVQLRPKRALNTLARAIINTTLGIGGLFDIAKRKPFKLPGHINNFSNSLAMLGMSSGPYLYLPLVGPTSFRDLIGAAGDTAAQPLLVDRVYSSQTKIVGTRRPRSVTVLSSTLQLSTFGVVLSGLSAVDRRSEADADLKALKASSVDPYVSLREAYLQNREAEIAALKAKDGQVAPVAAFDDPLADPAAAAPATSNPAPTAPAPTAPAR
jgi:phospholipid-binding lipoprotein MlaA